MSGKMLHNLYLLASAFCALSFFGMLCWNLTIRHQAANDWETCTSCVHKALMQCIKASKITDARIAWNYVTEARACIEQLCRLKGGEKSLGLICNADIMRILNTIQYQETQILKCLDLGVPVYQSCIVSANNKTQVADDLE